jgi:hypothetical protein
MVETTNIELITGATTLSYSSNVYLVTISTNSTITLPPIICDGINYQIIRNDTSNALATITSTSPDLLYLSSSVTGNVNLLPLTIANIQSYNNNWYITTNSSLSRAGRSIFTSAFVQNNGSPFITFDKVGPSIVCVFPYSGSSVERITKFSVVLSKTGTTATGFVTLSNAPLGIGNIASITYSTSSNNPAIFTTNVINLANLPTGDSVIYLNISSTNGNHNKTNIYSLAIN